MNLLKDPNKRKWVIVATMFIAIICNYLDRQLLSILKPEILEHFGIGDMQYAWIVNVFLICYALMYPVSGILVDRFGPKRVMLAGIAVWSLACIGGGRADDLRRTAGGRDALVREAAACDGQQPLYGRRIAGRGDRTAGDRMAHALVFELAGGVPRGRCGGSRHRGAV